MRYALFCRIGRGETQQKIYAEIIDDDIRISNSQGDKFTQPTEYTTEDLMLTIIVAGKGWIKEEVG